MGTRTIGPPIKISDKFATAAGEDRRTAGETLATAGGRASDAATVRGDAGSDRATTATDGIGGSWSSRQRDFVYKQKGAESGAISGYAGADGRPSQVLPMKIISPCREKGRRV